MLYRTLICFNKPDYVKFFVDTLTKVNHVVEVAHSLEQVQMIEDGHSYNLVIVDSDFDGVEQGWLLVKHFRTSGNWDRGLCVIVGLESFGRIDMPELPDELHDQYDSVMIMPSYLTDLYNVVTVALKYAEERVKSHE